MRYSPDSASVRPLTVHSQAVEQPVFVAHVPAAVSLRCKSHFAALIAVVRARVKLRSPVALVRTRTAATGLRCTWLIELLA